MKLKGHHIAQFSFWFFLSLTFSYILLMIKKLNTLMIPPIRGAEDFVTHYLNYHINRFCINSSDFTILLTVFIIVAVMVYFLDYTVGVGRSRSEERKLKNK